MNFELTQDQEMLVETVATFGAKTSPVARFRRLRDGRGWEPEIWTQMAELGWLGVAFPESVGGFGGGFVEVGLIVEKLGMSLVPEPYVPSVVLGGMALLRGGSAEQQKRWLAPMIEGRTSLALAYAERKARYAASGFETRAERDAGGYVLSGEKLYVLNGQRADTLIVAAALDTGVGLFALDRATDGLTVEPIRTMDGLGAASVRLTRVRCGTDRLLGDATRGRAVLEHVLDYGAAAAVAEGVGVCQRMLEMTVEYLKTREQFGVKIGIFQALQHRAVDMFIETELVRSLGLLACGTADSDDPAKRQSAISAAKAHLSVSGRYVSQQAIQLFGGVGVTDEHDIGLYFKRMHVLMALFGDEEHHVARFSRGPSFDAGVAATS